MEKRIQVSSSRSACLLALAVAWALFLALAGSPEALLFTVPLFLLAAPLAIGRYPGENGLAALRHRRVAPAGSIPGSGLAYTAVRLVGRIALPVLPGRGPPRTAH